MNTSKKYVVFVDLDKTILTVNSGKILVIEAYKSGVISLSILLRAIYLSLLYRLKLKNPIDSVNAMAKWLEGIEQKTMITLSDDIVDKFLIASIRSEIVEEINIHKNRGASIVLLSASLSYVCQPIANHLGMDSIICSKVAIQNGIFTGKPEGNICFGKEKEKQAQNYCAEHHYKMKEAYCYADSISDLAILSTTGHPICVAPERKLKNIAQKREWKIIS